MKIWQISIILVLLWACKEAKIENTITITYPIEGSVFPPDISSPTIKWGDSKKLNEIYRISILTDIGDTIFKSSTQLNQVKIDTEVWERVKSKSKSKPVSITVCYSNKSNASIVKITTSTDSVNAPIFYRAVPLPFKFARENLEKVSWHLGNISSNYKAPAVLENLPVCANCHSFSADGKSLGMDVDARDEKGAYAITSISTKTKITDKEIINWSNFQNGEFTYGLLSQLSPNGKFTVSTLKDCEIFVDLNNMEYSQLFFPFKGILALHNNSTGDFSQLAGADDSTFVHSNPEWSPNGEYIYFAKSKAAMFEESGVRHGSFAVNNTTYNKFLNDFIERRKLFKFDIYRIPFNEGKGGVAEPILGASNNGNSNFFPKISPDGKWMVYTQAESFMLLQKDSKLYIVPANGGEPRLMRCNTNNMNSWHSWSPNSKWLVFASKMNGPHTQLFLTHIDENGNDSPPILLENLIIDGKAANIPEFVNIKPETRMEIEPSFLDGKAFMLRMAQINNKKNDIEVALLQFNAILNENPKNADALVGRADILMKKKQTEKALADFSLAISIKPRMASYYIARGSAYGDIGQPSKAIDDFSKAIDLDAYSFMAYNNRGLIKFRQGKTDEAILDYTKSLELNDQAYMTMVNLGAALAKSKDLNQARTYFERAIKLQPDQTLAYVALATLMNQIGNTDESLKSINRALEIEPNKVDALNLRAVVLEKSMDYANALVDYTKILSLDNSIDAFRNAMRLCSLQNDYKTMINVTETLLQKTTPFTAEVLYYQGVAYYNLNKMDEACQAMTKSANLGYIKAKEELKRFCGKVG